MVPLFEKYRPKSYTDMVGQSEAVECLQMLEPRGLGGRGYWLAGRTGTGKTSLGYLIAQQFAGDLGMLEVDAASFTPKDVMDFRRSCSRRCIGEPSGWALILNEAHALRKDTVKALMNVLDGKERIPGYAVVIFTTTNEGEAQLFDNCIDAHPLMSRCQVLPWQSQGGKLELSFAIWCREVAQTEGLDSNADLMEYVALVRAAQFNLRTCLQQIEAGIMLKKRKAA